MRLRRCVDVETCTSPAPSNCSSFVNSARATASDGSSSQRRASICESLASSSRSFGRIATANSGSATFGTSRTPAASLVASVSPVRTPSSRAIATISPADAVAIGSCFLPCSLKRPAARTLRSRVVSTSVASPATVPSRMRTIDSLPDCGWIVVLQTCAHERSLRIAGRGRELVFDHVEQFAEADVAYPGADQHRDDLVAHGLIAQVGADLFDRRLDPFEQLLEQVIVEVAERLEQLRTRLLDGAFEFGSESRSPSASRSRRRMRAARRRRCSRGRPRPRRSAGTPRRRACRTRRPAPRAWRGNRFRDDRAC